MLGAPLSPEPPVTDTYVVEGTKEFFWKHVEEVPAHEEERATPPKEDSRRKNLKNPSTGFSTG